MNDSKNTNQPMHPDFNEPMVPDYNKNLSGSTPLSTESFNLNNQPIVSGWSPGIAPTPGPLNEVAPLSPVAPNIGVISSGSIKNNFSGHINITPPVVPASVPSPNVIQYEIKTLASDKETLRTSGGAETLPETISSLPNTPQTLSQASVPYFVSAPVSAFTPNTASTSPSPFLSPALTPATVPISIPIQTVTSTPAPAPAPAPASVSAPALTPIPVSVPIINSAPTQTPAPLSSVPTSVPTPLSSFTVSSSNITQSASIPSTFTTSATNPSTQTFSPSLMDGEDFFNPAVATVVPVKKKNIKKNIFIISAIIIFIGLGALIVLLNPSILITALSPVELTDPVIPPVIPVEETPPPVTETPTLIPVYSSFFSVPANFVERFTIENITLESLKQILFASLTGEPARIAARDRVIREVIITNAGAPLTFSSFLPTFLPNISAERISAIFEDNFTLFVHENRFIGFIAQTKIGTTPAELIAFSASFEASPNLNSLYATSPGTMATFREGIINGNPVRQASFSAVPGQNLNYGWFRDALHRNYLIVSISYEGEGIIEAVRRARLH